MQSKTVFSEAELLSEILKKYPEILTGDCAIKGILSPSINFVQAFLNPNSDLKPWRLSYCEATNGSSIIFTPDGKINSCLSVAGHQNEYIGTFDSEGVKINKERSSRWFDRNPLKIKKCAECRYALICGGGCPIYALKKNRDTMNPVCPCIKEVLDVYFNVIKQIYINKIHQIKTSSKVKE